jgi:hypothetical protein
VIKTKAKRKARVQWGVWIPCESKPDAEVKLYGLCYRNHAFHGWAKVVRLPVRPKGRKL